MTLVEFIHPVKQSKRLDQVLCVLYFLKRYEHHDSSTVAEVRGGLSRGRVSKPKEINVASVLANAAPYVDNVGKRGGSFLWTITETGEEYVRNLLQLPSVEPEVEQSVGSLESLSARLEDEVVRGYVEEAITCIRARALRASVVFLWSGAVQVLREEAWSKGSKAVNAAVLKHDPKARRLNKADDFAYVRDEVLLLACQELGIFDKGQRGTMNEALGLRNKCGHPTKYKAGVAKVTSFIEDVTGIVWPERT